MSLISKAKHKNIQVVLRQAEALDAAGIDIVVVGGARIFEGEAELDRPNVRLTGYVTDDDLAALMKVRVVWRFPSQNEGFRHTAARGDDEGLSGHFFKCG